MGVGDSPVETAGLVAGQAGILPGGAAIGGSLPLIAQIAFTGRCNGELNNTTCNDRYILRLGSNGDGRSLLLHDGQGCSFCGLAAIGVRHNAAILTAIVGVQSGPIETARLVSGQARILPGGAAVGGSLPLIAEFTGTRSCNREFNHTARNNGYILRLLGNGNGVLFLHDRQRGGIRGHRAVRIGYNHAILTAVVRVADSPGQGVCLVAGQACVIPGEALIRGGLPLVSQFTFTRCFNGKFNHAARNDRSILRLSDNGDGVLCLTDRKGGSS